ncbi:hypothetical protein NEMIN01_1670 [Nematocida minor]|uniref:uncharacterized protein n=1 Tax=Nematocida minor TaxID=1912983 RepID=UPI0022207565|nr:uncharacterized protein NEMIN01_1670 [Nematocida minor]KAI5191779.1 hypothetical protein NEMIN01_1670 [Nematocida minor]
MRNTEEKMLAYEEVKERLEKYVQDTKCTQMETMKYVVQSVINRPHAPVKLKEKLLAFGVTEFEAVQLLNNPPKKILDLYIIVEELEERLSEESIGEILALLSPYAE